MKNDGFNEGKRKKGEDLGYVYIGTKNTLGGLYKIGRTKNLKKRLIELKREYGSNFYYIHISGMLKNYINTEMDILDICGVPVQKNEWFELGQIELESIIRHLDKQC